MMIITPSVNYNSGWNVWVLNDLIKAPKVVVPTNKKTLSWNFWDQCNKQSIGPSLSGYIDRGKFVVNLGSYYEPHSISLFIQ